MQASIIITNYNYGAYLAQAVDSALAQDLPQTEVIVVDDGSTDDSLSILARYGEQIRVIEKPNSGQLASANLGYAQSRGTFVVFLDSDDVVYPDALRRHHDQLQHPGAVASQGALDLVDAGLGPLGRTIPWRLPTAGDYRGRFVSHGPRAYTAGFTSGIAWTRAFLDRVMPLPQANHAMLGPDSYLSTIAPLFGRIERVSGTVGQYRVHDHNRGPTNFRFDAEYVRGRLDGYLRRADFAASWAERLGVAVDREQWLDRAGWQTTLLRQASYLLGAASRPTPWRRLAIAPWYESGMRPERRLAWSLLLTLTRLLPPRSALWLARRLLERSWNQVRHGNAGRPQGGVDRGAERITAPGSDRTDHP